jgi:type I restriction enzyme S subunit
MGGWPEVALESVCDINVGRTPSRHEKSYWENGIHPWVSISDMTRARYISKTRECISEKARTECNMKPVPEGTVLISFKLSIGKVSFSEKEMFTNEAIAALPIIDSQQLDPHFLARALEAIDFNGVGNRAVMGLTLNKASLKQIKIPLPPLEEQKRIAAILDQADDLRRKRQHSIDRLNQLGQAIFHEMFGDLEANSHNFPMAPLHELIKVQGGYAFKSDVFQEEGSPVIRISNIDGVNVDFQKAVRIAPENVGKGRAFTVSEGELLIAMSGATTGKTGIVPNFSGSAYLNQRVGKYIILDNKNISICFLTNLVRSEYYQKRILDQAWGAAQPNVSSNQLVSFAIPLPPIFIQNRFTDIMNGISDVKIASDLEIKRSEALFASLQHRAFWGDL